MALRPEDLLNIKEDAIRIHAAMSGEFDEKIAEMKQLATEMGKLAAKVGTVKRMEEFVKAAEDEAASIKKSADDYYAQAEVYEQNLKTRIEDFDKRVAEHVDIKNAFETFKNAAIAEIDAGKKFVSDKTDELKVIEQSLDNKRLELAAWEEKIAAREKKLLDQIAAFKKV